MLAPPYSSPTVMPSTPSAPIFCHRSIGNWSLWSIWAARGAISLWANSRTASRSASMSSPSWKLSPGRLVMMGLSLRVFIRSVVREAKIANTSSVSRHCEAPESGPIPHMDLEPSPVTASVAWQSMQSEVMDCRASLAKTESVHGKRSAAIHAPRLIHDGSPRPQPRDDESGVCYCEEQSDAAIAMTNIRYIGLSLIHIS